ncbi:hypothetical protein SUDANB146_06046 [Streptomyces sp. enrichment culture]
MARDVVDPQAGTCPDVTGDNSAHREPGGDGGLTP